MPLGRIRWDQCRRDFVGGGMKIGIVTGSLIDKKGMITLRKGFRSWDENQAGAADLRRDQVFDRPHTGFGKLLLPEKLAFAAVSLALREVNLPLDRTRIAIVLGTASGSLSTDIDYMKSVVDGFPSPAIFAATLPSSPLAEIAIMHNITGPNRVFVGANSIFDMLEESDEILRSSAASFVLSVFVDDCINSNELRVATLITAQWNSAPCIMPLPQFHSGLDFSYFRAIMPEEEPDDN